MKRKRTNESSLKKRISVLITDLGDKITSPIADPIPIIVSLFTAIYGLGKTGPVFVSCQLVPDKDEFGKYIHTMLPICFGKHTVHMLCNSAEVRKHLH